MKVFHKWEEKKVDIGITLIRNDLGNSQFVLTHCFKCGEPKENTRTYMHFNCWMASTEEEKNEARKHLKELVDLHM